MHTDTPRIEAAEGFGGLTRVGWVAVIAVFMAILVDGMDNQLLYFAVPVLMKQWALSKVAAGALGSYQLIGLGIGGITGGWFSDRIGRVKVMLIALTIFAGFNFIVGFAQDYNQFAICRFLGGLGLGALYTIGMLLAAEYVPTVHRGKFLSGMAAAFSIGLMCAALLAGWIIPIWGWRTMFIASIVPGLICFIILCFVKDPQSYTAVRAAKLAAAKEGKTAKDKPRNEYALMFANAKTRKTFLIWVCMAITMQFGYAGATNWMPTYLVNELGINFKSVSWYLAASYLATVIGKLLAGVIADKFGRSKVWLFGGVSTAIVLPLLVHYAGPANAAVLMLIFGFFYGIPYAINPTFMNESFPTEFRGTATGAAHNLGRIGSTLSPIMIGLVATKYTIGAGLVVLAGAYLFTGILGGFFMKDKMYDPKAVGKQI